jgi:hypothetical protein
MEIRYNVLTLDAECGSAGFVRIARAIPITRDEMLVAALPPALRLAFVVPSLLLFFYALFIY